MAVFDKSEEIGKLLLNPKLSSDWIEMTTNVVEKSNGALSVEDLLKTDLNPMEIQMIAEMVKYFGDNYKASYNFVCSHGFNESQLQVIAKCLESGITVERVLSIVDKDTPYGVMNWILAGISDGYEQFSDPIYKNYHPNQLQEIYSGLKDGIDISDYDKPTVDSRIMQVIRHARCVGLTATLDAEKTITIY